MTGGSGQDRFILFDLSPFDFRKYSWQDPTNVFPLDSAYFSPDNYAIITDFDLNDDQIILPAIHTHGDNVSYEAKSIIFDDILSTGIYANRTSHANLTYTDPNERNFDDNLVAVVHGISNDNFNISNHIDFIGTLGPNNYVTSTGTYVSDVFKTDPFAPVNMNSDWSTPLLMYNE